MVTIRLSRQGAKGRPFYHVTVTEHGKKRDGRFIERIGFFDPNAQGKAEALRVDLGRADYWISVGARPSASVADLLQKARKLNKAAVAA